MECHATVLTKASTLLMRWRILGIVNPPNLGQL